MYDTIQELYYWCVERKKLDCFPEDTARCEALFEALDLAEYLDLVNAKDRLVDLFSVTAFREGLRLGLALSQEIAPPPP